jgi:hypothetical protein
VDRIRDRWGKESIAVGRSIWTSGGGHQPPNDERADGSPLTSFLQAA